MFFGQYSLDTLLSLENTKEELNKKIILLKEQNAKAQKDYFELKGLYPNKLEFWQYFLFLPLFYMLMKILLRQIKI